MILKYFLPDRDFSWEELEKMSAKVPGKATWPAQMLLNLETMNFDVTIIESFDAKKFIKEGAEYLREEFGADVAEWQVSHSDIPQEQHLYQKMLDSGVHYEFRPPTLADIKHYLTEGYLVKVSLNSKHLNHKPGYVGHSVVVYDIDDEHIVFHDPGLPAQEARVETLEHFESAWASPNEKAKELIAVKYKG